MFDYDNPKYDVAACTDLDNISDNDFRVELDGYLKKLNITKKERNEIICSWLDNAKTPEERGNLLEHYRALALKPKEKCKSEDEEQIDFVYRFRKKYPGVLLFCVWNGGTRTPGEARKQVVMGVVAGVSDLICPELKIAIEMKREKGGVWDEKQKDFREEMMRIGWHYILAYGADDGMKKVEDHLYMGTVLNK